MSYASAKGYRAEADVVDYMTSRGYHCWRRDVGMGDIDGVPFVLSVKDWRQMQLAGWVDDLTHMIERSPWDVGAVIHKRARRGNPAHWYATTPFANYVDLLDVYVTTAPTARTDPPRTRARIEQQR